MTSIEHAELDHSKMKIVFHDGLVLPEYYEPVSEHLPKIKAMKIRDDDVLLCSFPKSGTHWLYRVIDMMQRGQAEYVKRNPDSTFLDVQDIDSLDQLQSPRVLMSRMPFERLPAQALEKRTKLVHVYRNPRAVLVSFYFQMKNTNFFESSMEEMKEFTLDKAAGMFFSEKMPYSGWFGYVDKLQAFKHDNPEQPIFDLSYEEMTLNPMNTVKKLGEFLGKPVTPPDVCGHRRGLQLPETESQ